MSEVHRKRETKSKKTFEFDYEELNRKLTTKRVLDQVADMIEAERCPTQNDTTSNLYRVLVKKLKVKISELEDDPKVCEVAAKKLARWVEGMMKEAYSIQKLRNLNWAARSGVSSQRSLGRSKSAHSIKTLDATGEGPKPKEVLIEKVPMGGPIPYERTGQIYSTNLGGRRVYVEEVRDGNKRKALVSREKANIKNPMLREWSTWMVDLAAKTKSWVQKIDDKPETASGIDSWDYLMEESKTDSIAWRKRRLDLSASDISSYNRCFGGTSTDTLWKRDKSSIQNSFHERTKSSGREEGRKNMSSFVLPTPPRDRDHHRHR